MKKYLVAFLIQSWIMVENSLAQGPLVQVFPPGAAGPYAPVAPVAPIVPAGPVYPLKTGFCPTIPIETFNAIACIDDSTCPGISKCCLTLRGPRCLVPTALPPRGTAQPCGGLYEQWESCTTPCPPSCEFSTPYDVFGYHPSTPLFSRNIVGACAGCLAGCTCISGYLRERLQGGSPCIPAGAVTCIALTGFPSPVPFDWFSRSGYPSGLRYPSLYWNTLINRYGQQPPVGAVAPVGPLAPVAQFGPVAPFGPVEQLPFPQVYPNNVLGGPEIVLPYGKRSKDKAINETQVEVESIIQNATIVTESQNGTSLIYDIASL